MTAPERPTSSEIQHAYETCLDLATSHYENFPVVSRLLPEELRAPTAAIYAFARTADDFADEGSVPAEVRRASLSSWREKLYRCVRGEKIDDPSFIALADTITRYEIPVELLDDLIKAFERDTFLVRFETFDHVLDYCRYSANPVGRLILWIHGYRDEERALQSDAICTALQLANFWQDTAKDLRRNRIYYPLTDLKSFGLKEEDLFQHRWSDAVRDLVRQQVERTQKLFDQGRPLCESVSGRLGFHLRLTWNGGFEITRKIEREGFNVFQKRPKITSLDKVKLVWNALRWQET